MKVNKGEQLVEGKIDVIFQKRLIYKISLFVLLLSQVYLCIHVLTTLDEANFFLETMSRPVIALLTTSVTTLLGGFLIALRFLFGKISDAVKRTVFICVSLLAFSIQCYFLLHVRNLYLFDNAFVTGGASTLALGQGVAEQANYYFSVYPNQNAYIVLSAFLWKLGSILGLTRGQIPILLNAVNMLCIDVSMVLIFRIFCQTGKEKVAADKLLFWIMLLIHPFWYIGVCYYYTITLAMPFFMGAVYLFAVAILKKKSNRFLVWIWMGVLFAIGYLLRPTTIIPMIAVVFILIYFGPRKKQIMMMLATVGILVTLLGRMEASYVGLETKDTAFPTLHWVMMSLTSPGSHNAEDEAYTASFATKEEKVTAVKDRLAEKLNQMDGSAFATLLLEKMKNTWGNGSNGYTVYLEHCVSTDGLYEWIFGQHKDGVILYHQAYYLLWMLLFVIQIIKNLIGSFQKDSHAMLEQEDRVSSYIWQLTYLGGILFYLLWETSGQYSLPFLPILFLGGGEVVGVCGKSVDRPKKSEEKGCLKDKRFVLAGMAIYLMAAVFLFAFLIKKSPVFVEQPHEFSHPVYTQILANDEILIGGEDVLEQTFTASDTFDKIIFQYTNPNGEKACSVYKMKLMDERQNTVYATAFALENCPGRGAAILDVGKVLVRGKQRFTLRFEQIAGTPEERFGLIAYRMGHYDANPNGICLLNGQEIEADMLLSVSENKNQPYINNGAYRVIVLVVFAIVFLPIFGILVYTIKYMDFFQK